MRLADGKVLVTGAEGFIGSHLAEALVRRGVPVRALVLYNSFGSLGWLEQSPPEVKGAMEVVLGDVRDPSGMRRALEGCHAVLHLAALIAIPFSYHAPDAYLDTNVRGTLNVLQAARDLGTARVLVTSTSEVYGTAQRVPIDETHPLNAQSPYAATKIAADQMALSFHRSFGTPVVLARPFNTYGPRQSARAVIPTVATQLLAGKASLGLGATTPTRDFSYVADTAAGLIALAECDAALGETVNLGSGFEISVGETARLIAEIVGRPLVLNTEAERLRPAASEVERLWSDTTKMRRLTGWQPAYGGLEGFRRGLAETVAWFAEPANLALYKTDRFQL